MKKVLFGFAILMAMGTSANAFDYYNDRPLFFTYQNSKNYWFACGPIQCIQSGNRSEEAAADYVLNERHGSFNSATITDYNYGRCRVYIGSGIIKSYDHQPAWIIKRMKKKCR